MPASPPLVRDWDRIAPTLLIVGILAATALVLFPPMYSIGKRYDDRRIFLRNYRAPNEYEAFSSYCMEYARQSDEANDVVFVGDSSLRYDLRTSQFQRETGLKAYNLGSVGLIAISGFTRIVEAYLASSHPRPRLIVLGILPTTLDLGDDRYRLEEERDVKARFQWCFGPGTEDLRPHDSFWYHVRQGFKTTYGRLAGGFERFANEPIPFRGPDTYRTFQRAQARERGYSEGPDRPIVSLPARDKASTRDPFTITDKARDELSGLIRLTADHGITLMIRLTPYSGEAAEHSPRLRAWAEDLEVRNPHVIVDRPEVLLYDPGLFFDENHLRPAGAEKFTAFVAAEVKKVLAEGRGGAPRHPARGEGTVGLRSPAPVP